MIFCSNLTLSGPYAWLGDSYTDLSVGIGHASNTKTVAERRKKCTQTWSLLGSKGPMTGASLPPAGYTFLSVYSFRLFASKCTDVRDPNSWMATQGRSLGQRHPFC